MLSMVVRERGYPLTGMIIFHLQYSSFFGDASGSGTPLSIFDLSVTQLRRKGVLIAEFIPRGEL